MVVLGSKQEGTLKLVNPKHEDWASIQFLTLSLLTFLFTLSRCQVIFQGKQKEEKLLNALRTWRNFCVDLTLQFEIYLSIFLGVFARIVKVTYFAQVVNFSERVHRKVHPRKVNRQIGKDGNGQTNNNDKK